MASRVGLLGPASPPRPQDADGAGEQGQGRRRGRESRQDTEFVKTTNGATTLDQAALARARRLVGLKGHVTNIPAKDDLGVDGSRAATVVGFWRDFYGIVTSRNAPVPWSRSFANSPYYTRGLPSLP